MPTRLEDGIGLLRAPKGARGKLLEFDVAKAMKDSVSRPSVSTLSIRLPEAVELRLNQLARKRGLTKTALARQAIIELIDDLEDQHVAEARARKNRETIPLAEVERYRKRR